MLKNITEEHVEKVYALAMETLPSEDIKEQVQNRIKKMEAMSRTPAQKFGYLIHQLNHFG